MEVKIPEETIILTKDTPTTDNTWDLIGIKDPAAEIKSMEEMGVQSIFLILIQNHRKIAFKRNTGKQEYFSPIFPCR